MEKSVYLDTTIPSFYFDSRKSIKFQRDITKQWFKDESSKYDIFLSEATIYELQQGKYQTKIKFLDFSPNMIFWKMILR